MKKLLAIVLAVVMLIATLPLSVAAQKAEPPKPGKGESYGYYYEHMTDKVAKRAYEALSKSKDPRNVSMELTELNKYQPNDPRFLEEVGKLQQKVLTGAWCWRYDHVAESDFYTSVVNSEVTGKVDGGTGKAKYTVTIKQSYHPYYNASLEKQRDKAIKAIADKAKKEKTVFAKLRSVHDQIAAMGTYNYAALNEKNQNSKNFFYAHSSLGILLAGTGVCESYAKIFAMVCAELGIKDCVCLISTNHMWNAVKVEGKWYAVDVTWDDQESDREPIHTYFLSSDPDVLDGAKNDHKVDATYTVSPHYASAAYRPEDTTVSLSAPKVQAANTDAGITLTWNKVDKAAHYLVYRRDYKNGKWTGWKQLKAVASTTCTDNTAKNGGDYQYTVKAQNEFLTSDGHPTATIRRLATPAGAMTNSTAGIKLSWGKVSGATGYKVYRATSSGGKWSNLQLLDTTKSTSYTDKTAKAGKDYRYALLSYHGDSVSDYNTSVVIRRLTATTITVANTEKAVKVSWKKVSGAAGYYVYRATATGSKWSSWKKVKTTKSTAYEDKSVKNGVKYRYKIRAYYGSSSAAEVTSTTVERLTATSTKVAKVSGGIKVTWSKNKSADGYYLYRRQYKNGKWSSWTKLGSTKKTAYTDKKAKKGVNYQYSVRSVSGSSISAIKASKKVKR